MLESGYGLRIVKQELFELKGVVASAISQIECLQDVTSLTALT